MALPQKKYYRQRAHSNPIADHCFDYPSHPDDYDWSSLYPILKTDKSKKNVEFLDVGCGYGGLLVTLSPMFPDNLMLGLEIRVKVSDYVNDRIEAFRKQFENKYQNIAVLRTNAMKYLPNFFHKGQLKKMFFLYPDPHFKKAKHKWRIINKWLLSEYAYVLAEQLKKMFFLYPDPHFKKAKHKWRIINKWLLSEYAYVLAEQLKKMFFLYPDPHFKKAKHKWRIINKWLLSEYAYVLAEQLKKMFFLYPDPHFKKAKHKWRIINKWLLSEYAYVLAEQLKKMFFLYPDPHFKKAKHKWRIINKWLLSEYAYVLAEQGIVYTITDVKDLHEWMVTHFEEHPLFKQIPEDELKNDVIVDKLFESTEEGQKVTRNNGEKFLAVFQRVPDNYLENNK